MLNVQSEVVTDGSHLGKVESSRGQRPESHEAQRLAQPKVAPPVAP